MKVWRLRPKMDKRFLAGHPWVYSNELAESPKGIEPGEPIELRDAGGKFLARGYGNPSSLIAFRALSRDERVADPASADAVAATLARASQVRALLGWNNASYRLCFGESDFLPGLVIDRYRVGNGQVFAVQAHTAGMDRLMPRISEILERVVRESAQDWERGWESTAIVTHNDISVRKLEGIALEEARVLKEARGIDLTKTLIRTHSGLEFETDLVGGQKTGFFLDQAANIARAVELFRGLRPQGGAKGAPLRIIDLCCYVGQWGAHLGQAFRAQGVDVEVTAVDASEKALAFAKANLERQGVKAKTLKADVLRDLPQLADNSFDIVVCDPPALIKGRKDIPQGTHAYLQLNTQALRLAREGGAIISCSCSALLEEQSMIEVLAKAARRNGKSVRWVARGSQAPDHPSLAEFPEGKYLKAHFGVVG